VAPPPAGVSGAARGAREDFDSRRKREAASHARSAPPSAADWLADSRSSAMDSIPAGSGVCGHGRAERRKVSTSRDGSAPDPEHMTRAEACPAVGGRQRARRAQMSCTPRAFSGESVVKRPLRLVIGEAHSKGHRRVSAECLCRVPLQSASPEAPLRSASTECLYRVPPRRGPRRGPLERPLKSGFRKRLLTYVTLLSQGVDLPRPCRRRVGRRRRPRASSASSAAHTTHKSSL
jgi:hypothetical protein